MSFLVFGSVSHYMSGEGTFWQKAFVLHPILMGVGCVGLMTDVSARAPSLKMSILNTSA